MRQLFLVFAAAASVAAYSFAPSTLYAQRTAPATEAATALPTTPGISSMPEVVLPTSVQMDNDSLQYYEPTPQNIRSLATELPDTLLSVYPVPAKNVLTLVARDPKIRFAYLDCRDALGNPLTVRGRWKDGAFHILAKEIPNGSYTLFVQIDKAYYRAHIAIEH